MRRLLIVLAFVATPLFAQDTRSMHVVLQPLLPVVDRVESDVQRDAEAIKRDAYIHGELVAVADTLRDFQPNVAVQRARERLNYMARHIGELKEPPPASTMAIVAGVREALDRARDEGDSVNLDEVQRDIRRRAAALQMILFSELENARLERRTLSDAQVRIMRMTDALDAAMNQALMSMVDYVRGGVKN